MKGKNTIINIRNQFSYKLKSHQLQSMEMGKIRLSNGLNAVLISDKNTPISSAALSIDAGSWHDGKYAGSAHFLEHMLFLGTKKYPSENEYKRFISDANGSLNGYTANDHSLYYFQQVTPKKLVGALDRFSRFFYEPLFNENCVEREMIGNVGLIAAVDEEYKKNILSDGWRAIHVRKELSSQVHPYSGFNTGNLETMKLIDQKYLKNWFHTHYSSNLMNLVVVGKQPLSELQDIVAEHFLPIQNHNITNRLQKQEIFSELKGKVVWIQPIKNLKELTIAWEIPFEYCDMLSKPASLLSFSLGHEGENSLLSLLKKHDLAEGISAGQHIVGQKNVLYEISVVLTEKGLSRWMEVISRIVQAIDALKTQDFPKHIFHERNLMSKISYEYQQRSSGIAVSYAKAMRRESLETFPRHTITIDKFDPDAISNLLKLLKVENSFVEIMAQNPPYTLDRQEKWMGARYTVFPLAKCSQPSTSNEILYPKPNILVPSKLDVLAHEQEKKKPVKIFDNNGATMFYLPDFEFKIPKSEFIFVSEQLNEMSYNASLAGLHYSTWVDDNTGIGLSVDGYSQNLKMLLDKVLVVLKNPEISTEKFRLFKASLSQRYNNYIKNSPLQRANERFYKVIMNQYVTEKEMADSLDSIAIEDLQAFIAKVYQHRTIEAFAGGNCSKSESLEMMEAVLSVLGGVACDPSTVSDPKLLAYKDESIIEPLDIQVNGNAIVWSQYVGKKTDQLRCDWEILSKLIKEPFYSELRTKQQTGYIVSSGALQIDKQFLYTAYVQSNSYQSDDLNKRVDLFHKEFLQNIDTDLNRNRFESIRESCLKRLRSPFDQLSTKNDYYCHMAFKENQDFDALERRISIFENYEFSQLIEFANTLQASKKKLSVLATGKD
ncbi:hypothetical protein HDV01_000078 [Terramyces sp. JEL0728]|nr:hypothetical protein HDV01_000078 [Terramyces sp. JEL0728]